MTGRFLRRLLGPPPADSPELTEALRELDNLEQERPALGKPAALLRDILPVLFGDPIREVRPPLVRETVSAKLAAGVSLLRGEPLPLDVRTLRQRWLAVCAVLRQHHAEDTARKLAEFLRRGRLDPAALVPEVLAGRPDVIHNQADVLQLDVGVTALSLRLTLFPLMAQLDAVLRPLRGSIRWEHGYCPTCGGWPLLGELRGLEQTRFLRCGLCAAAWECPRLFCPFCGTRDHLLLGYIHVEGEEAKQRAVTCDACRRYVKTVATLSALSAPRLLVADLATTYLDLAAAERGFYPPVGSGETMRIETRE